MHEYYVFPMSCISDLKDMNDNEKRMFIEGIMRCWEHGGLGTTEYESPAVRIALRHAVDEIREIKKKIEG